LGTLNKYGGSGDKKENCGNETMQAVPTIRTERRTKMAMKPSTAKKKSAQVFRAKAVQYLREHPELFRATDREIAAALKKAGVMGATTYYRDCNIRAAVGAATKGGIWEEETNGAHVG